MGALVPISSPLLHYQRREVDTSLSKQALMIALLWTLASANTYQEMIPDDFVERDLTKLSPDERCRYLELQTEEA